MITETMSTYHHTDEDGYEGQRVMDAVMMLVIYLLFPALFWAVVLYLLGVI